MRGSILLRGPASGPPKQQVCVCVCMCLCVCEGGSLRKQVIIKCETSTLAWPRSLRLGRLHTGALHTATHEDLRDAHK